MCEFRSPLSGHAKPSSQTGALRVLLVDDNADVTESLRVLLDMHGHRVLACLHPRDALDAALSFDPDVCILDIGLPGMSGHELARALRASGLTRSTYIAVTGYGSAEARKASHEAGFSMHLTKPVNPDYLLEQVARVAKSRAAATRKSVNDLAPSNGWVASLRVAS